MSQDEVLREVAAERKRQDELWGEQNHDPLKYLVILNEEVGEANKAICDSLDFATGFIFQKGITEYRKELVQVAAVAVAMIECVDRKEWETPLQKNQPMENETND
jgi:hypothetical protein